MSKFITVAEKSDHLKGVVSFEERERELQEKEKQEKFEREQKKKSPYNDFIQMNNNYYKQEDWLMKTSPIAYRILRFLISNMDNYNAVICSYTVLQEYFNISKPTVTRAIRILKDHNFIDTAKTRTTNIYFINKELVWKSWGTNYKYAEFGAKIIVSESEQETIKTKTDKANIINKK